MNDETMGQEDAAQDAEACAEALESLDRISLDEIAFDDSGVDVQDEPETRRSPMIRMQATLSLPRMRQITKTPKARPATSPNPTRARKPSCSTACRPRIR